MISETINSLSEHECTRLLEALKADLSWEWDSRFEAAMAQFPAEKKDTMGAILENHLGPAWDGSSIDLAPEKVRRVLIRLGGIMHGQLLYAAGLPQDGILFCAWWPWGNGRTISIRLMTNPKGLPLLGALAAPASG